MIKLEREQAMAVAAAGALLILCVGLIAVSAQRYADAAQMLAERSELLQRLEAALPRAAAASAGKHPDAPAAAFLDAQTSGLAGAQLQAYVSRLIAGPQAVLISSALQPPDQKDTPDAIRLQATLDISPAALQGLLYKLETGTPYVFIDQLTVQPPGATGQRSGSEPLLRAVVALHAMWRRAPA
jgi:general secretion pathway protein M